MTDHKFKVGNRVSLSSRDKTTRNREFEVVRLLPAEGNEYQYCIKGTGEANQRVAKEYELRPYKA